MELPPRIHNWGRWGTDDEIGTANYVTAESIVAAARLVRRGLVISCAVPLDERGPVYPTRLPPSHMMTLSADDYAAGRLPSGNAPGGGVKFADDYIFAALQCSTQWDGLSHAWYGDQLYNGVPQAAVNATGASRLSIDRLYRHFVGRGVLLDLPRAFNNGLRLAPGYPITADDLDRAASFARTTIQQGDVVLVRTGHLAWFQELQDKREFWKGAPGLGVTTVAWLHEHRVAAVALDTVAAEVQPTEVPGATLPLHGLLIRDLGMTIGEIFDLDPLADACADDGVYEFLFVAQPLRIAGAVGSPINPLAIK
jgi:kynurenine formamidase